MRKLRESKAQFKRTAKSMEKSMRVVGDNPPSRKQFWYCAVLLTQCNLTDQDYFGKHWKSVILTKAVMIGVIKHLLQCQEDNTPAHAIEYQEDTVRAEEPTPKRADKTDNIVRIESYQDEREVCYEAEANREYERADWTLEEVA